MKKAYIFFISIFLSFWGSMVLGSENFEKLKLEVVSKPRGVEISWQKNKLNETENVIIIRKEES